MSKISPWDEIAIPMAEINIRHVSGETIVPCFWGRTATDQCLFIVELDGDHYAHYRKNMVTLHGIKVDLQTGESGFQQLVLTLEKHVDRDLFQVLCQSLVAALQNATDSASSIAVALTHLRRWKTFMSGQIRYLSVEEVRGLFAEIIFLLELSEVLPSHTDAVMSWMGPDKYHQDFVFGNTAVEVKSLSGTERNSVHISSENQLESLMDYLFLRIYRLSAQPDNANALSLNDIVKIMHSKLSDSDAVDEFDRKLSRYGFLPIPFYDLPRFVVSQVYSYRITNDFPCIVRSNIHSGIDTVSYNIRLEAISSYECDNSTVFVG
ncbi:MAG TPA: PD-(D/E)XK motif protein [Chlorobiota bacterium]|nr:PD-(D/E)XK motif protein [Chlorobiota bacterium]